MRDGKAITEKAEAVAANGILYTQGKCFAKQTIKCTLRGSQALESGDSAT